MKSLGKDFFYFLISRPMAITRQKKEELLAELSDKFSRAEAVVFAQNNGLQVKELEELRKLLRKANTELKIAKKRVMRIAAKNTSNLEIDAGAMEGPVAAVFGYEDALSVFKILKDFAAKNPKLVLLSGVFEGKVVDQTTVKSLADLPSKDQLRAQLLRAMLGPVSGFHGVLHGVLRNFVGVVDAYKDKKSA